SRKLSAVSTEDYLKETIDVQISDEIKKLANETLKKNPVLIYEYVRNNLDYEPYYGSLKGSQQTLWEKAGNDFDLASLLIALYRAANIPARYVYGTVEIPIEKAMNWVGVKDPYTAAQIFASGGIPSKAITSGGKIVAIRLEHCWSEVYIAYLPYSGAKDWNKGNKMWIPIDSSFKQYELPKEGTYNVITQRSAEITSEIATERDWLWGMPRKLNLMGISVDVGRDTSIVNPIDGDNSKIKKFITLTLYNGSVNEHLTLDIPMGTLTGVSAIKAIQISNQQGIPIYKIDKTNISSILPILQQDADVKGAIQDAVNAGCEVIIPEREITCFGWQGTGYIIQDPITGAGACLVSGGAAGAETLVTIGFYVDHFEKFAENKALIIEGESVSGTKDFRDQMQFIWFWYSGWLVTGATYLLGWCPVLKKIFTYKSFLTEISRPNYEVLYFVGHGSGGDLILDNDLLDVFIDGNPLGAVTSGQISGVSTDYTFVYIDACEGLPAAKAFKFKCALGYDYIVPGRQALNFNRAFWVIAVAGGITGISVITAKEFGEDFVREVLIPFPSWLEFPSSKDFYINLLGNGNTSLRAPFYLGPQ
ncbi:MAG: transglutaminase-like domain-containing protein, partial [bacterium]